MAAYTGLFVGLAFALAALATFRWTRRWRRGTVETAGTVVDRKTRLWSSNATWNAVFEFSTDAGEVVRVRSNTYSVFYSPEIGDTVPIRYSPATPRDARIDRWSHLYALPAILMFVAVAATSVWAAQLAGVGPQWGSGGSEAPPAVGSAVPDGRLPTALAEASGAVPEIATGMLERLRTFDLSDQGLWAAGMSPDGAVAALAFPGDSLLLLHLDGDSTSASIRSGGRVYSVGFSPDGERLAIGQTGRVVLVDVSTGGVSGRVEFSSSSGGQIEVTDLAVSPSGEVAAVTAGTEIVFIDLERGRAFASLPTGTLPLSRVAWSPDGRLLAALGSARELTVWPTDDLGSLSPDRSLCRLELPRPSRSLALGQGRDGAVVVLPASGHLLLVDPIACREQRLATPGAGPAASLVVTPDGRMAFVAEEEGLLRVVRLTDGRTERTVQLPGGGSDLLLSERGGRLLTFSHRGGSATLWGIR